jgi:hypothetical protein
MNQTDVTNPEIGDGDHEVTGESTSLSDIEEHDLDHQLVVLCLGQACQDKSSVVLPTVPVLDPAGFIGLCGNTLAL